MPHRMTSDYQRQIYVALAMLVVIHASHQLESRGNLLLPTLASKTHVVSTSGRVLLELEHVRRKAERLENAISQLNSQSAPG
jgi:hypothetical protein